MKASTKKMNSTQRYRVILDELEKKRYVTVQDFSRALGVSEVTIRKDLKDLERKKLLLRSHGGASPVSSLISDRHIDEKEKINVDEKMRIAEAASKLLNNNDQIGRASCRERV